MWWPDQSEFFGMSCRCPPGAVLYWNSSMFALWPMRSIVIRSIDVVCATSTTLATNGPAGNGPNVSGATAPSTSSNHSIAWLRSGTVIPTWSIPTRPSCPGAIPAVTRRAAAAGAAAAVPSAATPIARNSRRGMPAFTSPPPSVGGATLSRWAASVTRIGSRRVPERKQLPRRPGPLLTTSRGRPEPAAPPEKLVRVPQPAKPDLGTSRDSPPDVPGGGQRSRRNRRRAHNDDVGGHARPAGVAADRRHRRVLAVLPGCLRHATGPDRLHALILPEVKAGSTRVGRFPRRDVEGEHHPALVVLGDVAVRHPAAGVGDVEEDVDGLPGPDEYGVLPDEVRLDDFIAGEDQEAPGPVDVERVRHGMVRVHLVHEPELHLVADVERPVDLGVLCAGLFVDELPPHVGGSGHPVALDHVVFPLDPLGRVVIALEPAVLVPPAVRPRGQRAHRDARARDHYRLQPDSPAGASCRTWGSG